MSTALGIGSSVCCMVIASSLLVGCRSQPREAQPGEPARAASGGTNPPPASATQAATAAAASPPPATTRSNIPRGKVVPPFTVVPSPTAKDVPSTPVAGSANAHSFEVKRIEIIATSSEWWLTFIGPSRTPEVRWDHDSEYARVRFGYVEDGQNAYESSALPKRVFRKQLGAHDPTVSLSFNVADPADPASTISHGRDGSLYLEFTSWKVKPWDDAQKHHVAGVASGKIYLALAGNASVAASGVVGEFKDVPISRTLLQP